MGRESAQAVVVVLVDAPAELVLERLGNVVYRRPRQLRDPLRRLWWLLDGEAGMSETCCDICGVAEDAAQHIYLRAIGKTGRLRCVEDGCGACDLRADLNEARAQYAALAAAHDAALAEAERRENGTICRLIEGYDGLIDVYITQRDAAVARAESAEAALERGVRELQSERFAALERAASVWERRALAAEAQRAAAREDGARSMATFIADDLQWATEGNVTLHPDRLLAAWQAAQNTGVTNDA